MNWYSYSHASYSNVRLSQGGPLTAKAAPKQAPAPADTQSTASVTVQSRRLLGRRPSSNVDRTEPVQGILRSCKSGKRKSSRVNWLASPDLKGHQKKTPLTDSGSTGASSPSVSASCTGVDWESHRLMMIRCLIHSTVELVVLYTLL